MNFTLTPTLEEFVRERVNSGDYGDADEVLRDALLLLKRREEYRRKQERLRHAIQEGIKDFAKGDFITLKDDKELNNFFASL